VKVLSKVKSGSDAERRGKPRSEVVVMAVATAEGQRSSARLYDISASGALLGPIGGVAPGAILKLEVPGHGTAAVVRVTPRRTAVTFPPDPALRALFDRPEELHRHLVSAQ